MKCSFHLSFETFVNSMIEYMVTIHDVMAANNVIQNDAPNLLKFFVIGEPIKTNIDIVINKKTKNDITIITCLITIYYYNILV